MTSEAIVAEISDDGRYLICRSVDGRVKWMRGAPSNAEWHRLRKRSIDSDVEAGRFKYVESHISEVIVAVFTPYRGLDFNLTYTVDAGELIKISEAR
jgi:hypothetical protein